MIAGESPFRCSSAARGMSDKRVVNMARSRPSSTTTATIAIPVVVALSRYWYVLVVRQGLPYSCTGTCTCRYHGTDRMGGYSCMVLRVGTVCLRHVCVCVVVSVPLRNVVWVLLLRVDRSRCACGAWSGRCVWMCINFRSTRESNNVVQPPGNRTPGLQFYILYTISRARTHRRSEPIFIFAGAGLLITWALSVGVLVV